MRNSTSPVIFTLLLFLFEGARAQSLLRTIDRLPDTGQQTGYTLAPGEDSDFDINPPGFVDNLDGTLTDTVTGLQWQQADGGEMTFSSARTFVDTLTLGGFTDWRLPSPMEAFSILNMGRANPALDTGYFTASQAEYWWTSDHQWNDSSKVWVTNAGGGIGNHPVSETISAGGTKRFHVRAVRDRTPPMFMPARFQDNADGTVTDLLTSLIWSQLPFADSLSWEDALRYADSLSAGGHGDWRLPNVREIQSLADYSRSMPAVNTTFFTGVAAGKYWSSTTLPNQTTKAWYLDTRFGITTYSEKTSRLMPLCVRGGAGFVTAVYAPIMEPVFQVYPNPVSEVVYLKGLPEGSSVVVRDILGGHVARWNSAGPFLLAEWPAGVYLLYSSEESSKPVRLIKR